MKDNPLLLTVTGAAKVLGLDRKTVTKMCKTFELRWIPRGKAYGKMKERVNKRIPRAELDRWIREKMVGSNQELREALDGRRTR